jgi:hypothetical protein
MVELDEKTAKLGLFIYHKGDFDHFDGTYAYNFELDFVLVYFVEGRMYVRNLCTFSRESPFRDLANIKLQSHHYISSYCTPAEPTRNFQNIYYDHCRSSLEELERAVKAMKRIFKAMDRYTVRFGKPESWQTFIIRYALVNKVSYIVECTNRTGSDYDGNTHEFNAIIQGVDKMAFILENDRIWREKIADVINKSNA